MILDLEIMMGKYKFWIIGGFFAGALFVVNPIEMYKENALQKANQSRLLVEDEFKKSSNDRDNEVLHRELTKIHDASPNLFSLVMIKNAFLYNEYKSLKLNPEIERALESNVYREIVDLELAIENKDLAGLERLYSEVENKRLKEYIVYVAKSLDGNTRLEFDKSSPMRTMYVK